MEFNFEEHVNKLFMLSGKKLSQVEFNVVLKFMEYLPHRPSELVKLNDNYYKSVIRDYDKSMFFDVRFYMSGKGSDLGEFRFTIVNQGLFESKEKARNNKDALILVEEYYSTRDSEIKSHIINKL